MLSWLSTRVRHIGGILDKSDNWTGLSCTSYKMSYNLDYNPISYHREHHQKFRTCLAKGTKNSEPYPRNASLQDKFKKAWKKESEVFFSKQGNLKSTRKLRQLETRKWSGPVKFRKWSHPVKVNGHAHKNAFVGVGTIASNPKRYLWWNNFITNSMCQCVSGMPNPKLRCCCFFHSNIPESKICALTGTLTVCLMASHIRREKTKSVLYDTALKCGSAPSGELLKVDSCNTRYPGINSGYDWCQESNNLFLPI